MPKLLLFFACMMGLMTNMCVAEDQKPEPGKQVPQKIELSKSTSVWHYPPREGDDKNVSVFDILSTPKPLDETQKEDVQYLLFLPKDYDANAPDKKWPLMLFLHGAGERGENIDLVTVHGPPKLIAKNPEFAEKCPFIVVSPQCKNDRCWSPAQLELLLDDIEKKHKVDSDRIYVTGISMGGFGSWMLTSQNPTRFAAVAPICGGFDTAKAENFVDVPMWVFHGGADSLVPAALSEKMVDAIEKAGGKKIKLTIYPGVNHDSWTQTYDNVELYKWFLSNQRENIK